MPDSEKGGVHPVERACYVQKAVYFLCSGLWGAVRKAKADTEREPAPKIKDNKKSFFKYIGRMKKAPGNVGALQDSLGNLVVAPEEKADL